ncbi:unnamed protein product [Boreogadus saida]
MVEAPLSLTPGDEEGPLKSDVIGLRKGAPLWRLRAMAPGAPGPPGPESSGVCRSRDGAPGTDRRLTTQRVSTCGSRAGAGPSRGTRPQSPEDGDYISGVKAGHLLLLVLPILVPDMEPKARQESTVVGALGNDEEALVDLGKTSSTLHTNFEKEELESHRAVYVGVHVPMGRQTRRRHRHRGNKHHRKRRERSSDHEDGRESPSNDTPSQRVQFILGMDDDDEEHVPHDLFTELDELAFRDGQGQEWKETAR